MSQLEKNAILYKRAYLRVINYFLEKRLLLYYFWMKINFICFSKSKKFVFNWKGLNWQWNRLYLIFPEKITHFHIKMCSFLRDAETLVPHASNLWYIFCIMALFIFIDRIIILALIPLFWGCVSAGDEKRHGKFPYISTFFF